MGPRVFLFVLTRVNMVCVSSQTLVTVIGDLVEQTVRSVSWFGWTLDSLINVNNYFSL